VTTTRDTTSLERTAAEAALAVPGVARLHPSLGQSLAGVVARAGHAFGSRPAESPVGIRVERTPGGDGCHVDVRCVLSAERRALDTARDVREAVRSVLLAHASRHGLTGPVTVGVTITRIEAHRASGPGSSDHAHEEGA
jgi:hypothetical protein